MYPVFLDLQNKKCLVVGGGKVALRKVLALLRSDASVTVVSIEYTRHFTHIDHRITQITRPFEAADITPDLTLIIGATNVMEVNRKIAYLAEKHTILCNIVDQPALCSFIVPAVVRRNPVTIAVSTGGAAPRLAKYCKTVAADTFPMEIQPLAMYLSTVRKKLFSILPDGKQRAAFWETLFSKDPLELIASYGIDGYKTHTETLLTQFSTDTKFSAGNTTNEE